MIEDDKKSDSLELRITQIQKELNSNEYVKVNYFVPNHLEFWRLVCVNYITALYVSGNFEPIPFLIKIARSELCRQPEIVGFEKFTKLATEYLEKMESFLCGRIKKTEIT